MRIQARSTAGFPVTAFGGIHIPTTEWVFLPERIDKAEAEAQDFIEVRVLGQEENAPAEAVSATASAEKLAEENGIPLELIEGTGAGGRVLLDDVRNYIDLHGV